MQVSSPRKFPQASTLGDLKELLAMVTNSKEAKASLDAIADKMAEQEKMTKKLEQLVAASAKIEEGFAKKEAELKDQAEKQAEMKKSIAETEAIFKKRGAAFDAAEKALEKKSEAFEIHQMECLKKIVESQEAVKAKHMEAQAASEKAAALISEYETKVAKLKAAVGG